MIDHVVLAVAAVVAWVGAPIFGGWLGDYLYERSHKRRVGSGDGQ